MAEYKWPDASHRKLIGKRHKRLDGPDKASGRARYTFDVKRPGMLWGTIVGSPHAHCRITSIDITDAQDMPGVKAVEILQKPGTEIFWAGDEIVAIAAVDLTTARDAARAIKIQYEVLPHFVSDAEPPKDIQVAAGPMSEDDLRNALTNQVPAREVVAQLQQYGVSFKPSEDLFTTMQRFQVPAPIIEAVRNAKVVEGYKAPVSNFKRTATQTSGNPDEGFKNAEATVEGVYGASVITHCCLESHGAMSEWTAPDKLLVYCSTQNVSGIPGQMADPLGVPAANIRVHQDHVGGGFGSKFGIDRWGIATAQLSKKADGKPVKIMLERDRELEVAGARPSMFARVKVGFKKDGTITAWQSDSWGTGGMGGGGNPPLPYVFNIPNQRKQNTAVMTNTGPARAWRAPNHPQACSITMTALEDAAAFLNMDPVEFFLKNIEMTGPRARIYREEFAIAAELMDWKKNWHPRGDKSAGPIKRGYGTSLHTWGGRGHASECDLTLQPDGSVSLQMGTQDLGTGTRTAITIVAAETLGLPMSAINLQIGDTTYPPSGGSGGSTTIGGVSATTRRATLDLLDKLFEKVAPALKAQPAELEAVDGVVRVKGDAARSLPWKQACAKIGAMPITVRGKNLGGRDNLMDSGVGGVQMAEVSVDVETGIVKVNKLVAVQDCGLVINVKLAESQCLGALIMGIAYSLYEERVIDNPTGRMLNANMEFYRLPNIGDIGELVVRMMTGPGYDERGVVGLGEPPVISPGAAISNAVANAIGVRVPFLPLTPDRVLAALEKAGANATV